MKWRPVDLMVGLLVCSVVYGVIIMGAAPFFDVAASEGGEGLKNRATFVASVVSIISMYVGASIRKGND